MAFLTQEQLKAFNFASLGDHVFISDKASIYNPTNISIGSYVRIDDFALLSAGKEGIEIGNYVHIACYSCMLGQSKITLHNYTVISIRSTILSSSSDFSGEYFPIYKEFVPLNAIKDITTSINGPVTLEEFAALGANSIIMPGCTIGKGSNIGAMSFVHKDINPGGFYWGNPARFVKKMSTRAMDMLEEHLKTSSIL